MTEAEVNKLAARVMRAKMMGRAEEAASLEAELQRAKAALAQAPPPPPKPVVSMSAAGGEVEVGVPNEMVGHIIGKEGASLPLPKQLAVDFLSIAPRVHTSSASALAWQTRA